MRRIGAAAAFLIIGCGSGPGPSDAGADAAAIDAAADAGSGARDAGPRVDDSCEGRYWRHYVGANNAGYADADGLAYSSIGYVRSYVESLSAMGASVTVGAVLSLLLWEGGARVAWVNDACNENSYVSGATCWETPQARFSYQLGMGAIHTSNFYPCRDVTWTSSMRRRFHDAIARHGFTVTPAQLASVAADLETICAGRTPEPIDYYILAIHRDFGVPVDTHANDVEHIGSFPFFDPAISIDLTVGALSASASALTDDRAMIARYGGADARYADPSYQDRILESWTSWQATECAP